MSGRDCDINPKEALGRRVKVLRVTVTLANWREESNFWRMCRGSVIQKDYLACSVKVFENRAVIRWTYFSYLGENIDAL